MNAKLTIESGARERAEQRPAEAAQETELSFPTRVRKLLGRIRRRFTIDRFDIFTRPVPPEPVGVAPEGYQLRWGTARDIERTDPFHTELDERERREGVQRLEFGHRVVIAFHGDLAVFSMWVNPRMLNIPGMIKRRLAPDQWFIYKAFTSPEHRGKKLYQAGMQFVLDEMAREGLRELVGFAHVKKRVSRKGLARLAFESVGRMTCVDVPGFRHTFVSKDLSSRFPEVVAPSNALKVN